MGRQELYTLLLTRFDSVWEYHLCGGQKPVHLVAYNAIREVHRTYREERRVISSPRSIYGRAAWIDMRLWDFLIDKKNYNAGAHKRARRYEVQGPLKVGT